MFNTTVTPYDDGMSIKDLYDNLKAALDQAMSPNKLIETLTSIENQAIKLQKSIGGVVDDTGAGRLLLLLHDALRIANCCLCHQ
jgi:hypothetical protein